MLTKPKMELSLPMVGKYSDSRLVAYIHSRVRSREIANLNNLYIYDWQFLIGNNA